MVVVHPGAVRDAPLVVRTHRAGVPAARVEVRRGRSRGLVSAVERRAVEHDAHDGGVTVGTRRVEADGVHVDVVRFGVAAALVHEELLSNRAAGARLEERRLARLDVHAARAVARVGRPVLARVRGPGVGGGRRGRSGAESRLERTVNECGVRRVSHGPEERGRHRGPVRRDGGPGPRSLQSTGRRVERELAGGGRLSGSRGAIFSRPRGRSGFRLLVAHTAAALVRLRRRGREEARDHEGE